MNSSPSPCLPSLLLSHLPSRDCHQTSTRHPRGLPKLNPDSQIISNKVHRRQEHRHHQKKRHPKRQNTTHPRSQYSEECNRQEFQRNCRRQLFVNSQAVLQPTVIRPPPPEPCRAQMSEIRRLIVAHLGPPQSPPGVFFFFFFFKSRIFTCLPYSRFLNELIAISAGVDVGIGVQVFGVSLVPEFPDRGSFHFPITPSMHQPQSSELPQRLPVRLLLSYCTVFWPMAHVNSLDSEDSSTSSITPSSTHQPQRSEATSAHTFETTIILLYCLLLMTHDEQPETPHRLRTTTSQHPSPLHPTLEE